MRHIVLRFLFIFLFPQYIQADNYWTFTLMFSAKLIQEIHKLARQEKKKNALQKKILQQNMAVILDVNDPLKRFKMFKEIIEANNSGLTSIITLLKENNIPYKNDFLPLEKGLLLYQKIQDSIEWAQQLTEEQREQFAQVQHYQFTQKDLKILRLLKARGYKDVPLKIIDQAKENDYIELTKGIKISKKLLQELEKNV